MTKEQNWVIKMDSNKFFQAEKVPLCILIIFYMHMQTIKHADGIIKLMLLKMS